MVRAAAQRLKRRTARREEEREARRRRAQSTARRIATILAEADPTLRRVIGFGSTFETWRTFREDSDIDLGIEGGDWFLLSRSIPSSEFEVSLVELELQNQEFSHHVRSHGETLYEKYHR